MDFEDCRSAGDWEQEQWVHSELYLSYMGWCKILNVKLVSFE